MTEAKLKELNEQVKRMKERHAAMIERTKEITGAATGTTTDFRPDLGDVERGIAAARIDSVTSSDQKPMSVQAALGDVKLGLAAAAASTRARTSRSTR